MYNNPPINLSRVAGTYKTIRIVVCKYLSILQTLPMLMGTAIHRQTFLTFHCHCEGYFLIGLQSTYFFINVAVSRVKLAAEIALSSRSK